jgi:hypothetical protein
MKMLKVDKAHVDMESDFDIASRDISMAFCVFIHNLSKEDSISMKKKSRMFKKIIYYVTKTAEDNGFDTTLDDEDEKKFREAYKMSEKTAERMAKLAKILSVLLGDDEDEDGVEDDLPESLR